MKYLLALVVVLLVGCQGPDHQESDLGFLHSQAAETASVYLFIMSKSGFEGTVEFLHPEYLRRLRAAIEDVYSKPTGSNHNSATDMLSDAEYIKLVYGVGSKNYEFVQLAAVSPITEFHVGDTKYIAVKGVPEDKSQRSEFVQLVALKKYGNKWNVYNEAELEKILDGLYRQSK